ncbi:SCP2 domain-containing protein [Pusillimonas sp. NJUB218]|uniref:ubiquinone biosynthesis accessory factor UbiJ n=1 Tax=Pusillimonas sp. NJUB218 TaxID=2023230 RepID=UPI000F4B687A|nr:SCP2 sterol-binding domain-containing protein [Pusillimonas sp. NJUB218]ROT44874.1 hypothetical protein CHR62_10625 [Pusillimonas sp. NJUB218]
MLPFFPPPPFVASAGISALNRLLRREPWAAERLSRHAGKTVRFIIGRAEVSLVIGSQGTLQSADAAVVPDVTLTLPEKQTGRLFDVIRHQDPEQIVDALHIQGDAGLANVVADLARHLRWDVEDDLARVVGDIPATRIMAGARAVSRSFAAAGQRLAGNVAEYLTEESPTLMAKAHLPVHQERTAQLLQQLDQLDRRVEQLERHNASGRGR